MDYKEKYEQALERAKELFEDMNKKEYFASNRDIENIFPELKEKERNDEKIRKAIIAYISHGQHCGVSNKDMLAWVEKQGEQKHFSDFNANDWYVSKVDGKIHNMTYNPNKVEPKFKVGDWIVQENIGIYKVIEVCESWYEVVDNKDEHYSIGFNKEYMCHLWSINDAKDGDALCYKDEISLYKHDIKNCTKQETTFGGFVYYCCYDSKRFIIDSLYSLTEQDKTDIHPATKEQRELLFQKMEEACYEWNSKKKELQKIAQKINSELLVSVLIKHLYTCTNKTNSYVRSEEDHITLTELINKIRADLNIK